MTNVSIAFDAARLPAYELAARVGEPAAPGGQTEVRLRGDGGFSAVQRGGDAPHADKQALEARFQMERPQVELILRSATQFDWSDRFPPRPGIPDEPIVHWSLRAPDGTAVSARMWLRDVERGALTGEVLALLRQVLERASDGRMYL